MIESNKMKSPIENLLNQAAAQSDSSAPDTSSVSSATRAFETEAEAENNYQRLKRKLFDIEQWNSESGISSFALYDARGNEQPQKTAAVGDYIKITLPGSGKDDWVKVIAIEDAPHEIVFTIQPAPNPTDKESDSTSHFFIADSTNNFCLQKHDARLNFYVIGLNEQSNTDDTEGVLETVRNFATANIGYYFGIQKTQWKIFCENFLELKSEK